LRLGKVSILLVLFVKWRQAVCSGPPTSHETLPAVLLRVRGAIGVTARVSSTITGCGTSSTVVAVQD
jgi:hypothetical protein